jgi:hypothetical protein
MIKILGPEGKEKGGVRKFYLARVCGKLEGERKILVMMKWDGHAKVRKEFGFVLFRRFCLIFFFWKAFACGGRGDAHGDAGARKRKVRCEVRLNARDGGNHVRVSTPNQVQKNG